MLFSSDEVSKYINDYFEPAWESVREVPIVTIDFGNGHKIIRTLNGNIATYVCASDGAVLDILPGIYTADAYRKQLEQLFLLYHYTGPPGFPGWSERLKDYHQKQSALLAKKQPPALLAEVQIGVSIAGIETTVRMIAGGRTVGDVNGAAQAAPAALPMDKLGEWKLLVEDTQINETVRRQAIHEKLAATGTVKSKDITKWLYKEVLKTDLDDPKMGLGDSLDRQNPFAPEDAPIKPKK